MKKTLVALAVVAASGASFAQVAITGTYAFGYKSTTNVDGKANDSSGLGMDTSYVQFAASEDLGAGLKASAQMSLDGLTRAGAFGGDSSIAIEGGFGKFYMTNSRGPDTMTDYVKGAVGMDGKVFSLITTSDTMAYLTPELFPGFKIQFQTIESAINQGSENVSPIGLGAGAAGAAVTATTTANAQRRNDVRFQYAKGPLAAAINFLAFDQQGDAALPANYNNAKNAARGYVRYDFGVARVGAAIYQLNYNVGKRTDTMLAVNVPLGSLDLGAEWAQRAKDGTLTAGSVSGDYTATGTALSAKYNLSKRTAVIGTYSRWDVAPGATIVGTVNETAILLSHSF